MPSLRDSIASTVKPFAPPMSVGAVAKLVGLGPAPVSGGRVLDFTSQPQLLHFPSLHANTVEAFATLALHASGKYVFAGHAHENGVVGDNYAMSCAINVRDDQGRALALEPHQKKLSGTVDPTGDRTDNFQIVGFDPRIRDRWREVFAASKQVSLHASTDPLQVVELVTETLVAALAVAGLVFLAVTVIPAPVVQILPTPDGSGFQIVFCWGACK